MDYSDQDARLHIDLETERTASGQWSSSGDANIDYDYISGFNHILAGSGDDYLEGSGTEENKINNIISGADGDDKIFGRHGDDMLFGGGGDDKLYGGFDNDILQGGDGDDFVVGGAGDDVITSLSGENRIYGEDGNDIIELYGGQNNVFGGDGDDVISVHAGWNARDYSTLEELNRNANGTVSDITVKRNNLDEGTNTDAVNPEQPVLTDYMNDTVWAIEGQPPLSISVGTGESYRVDFDNLPPYSAQTSESVAGDLIAQIKKLLEDAADGIGEATPVKDLAEVTPINDLTTQPRAADGISIELLFESYHIWGLVMGTILLMVVI